MDKYLSAPMPSKTQRSRSERRPHDSKMTTVSDLLSEPRNPDNTDVAATAQHSPAPPVSGLPSPSEGPVTYSDMVRAVRDAMEPLIEAQTAKLQQAVQDMKTQLNQLTNTVRRDIPRCH